MDITQHPTQYQARDLLRSTMCVLVDWVDLDKGYAIKPYGRSAPAQEFRPDEFVYITSDLLAYRRSWIAESARKDAALADAVGAQVTAITQGMGNAVAGCIVKDHTALLGLASEALSPDAPFVRQRSVFDPDVKAARDFLNTPEARVLRALYQVGAITGTHYTDALEQLRGM